MRNLIEKETISNTELKFFQGILNQWWKYLNIQCLSYRNQLHTSDVYTLLFVTFEHYVTVGNDFYIFQQQHNQRYNEYA
jgi:hypothetical protein